MFDKTETRNLVAKNLLESGRSLSHMPILSRSEDNHAIALRRACSLLVRSRKTWCHHGREETHLNVEAKSRRLNSEFTRQRVVKPIKCQCARSPSSRSRVTPPERGCALYNCPAQGGCLTAESRRVLSYMRRRRCHVSVPPGEPKRRRHQTESDNALACRVDNKQSEETDKLPRKDEPTVVLNNDLRRRRQGSDRCIAQPPS